MGDREPDIPPRNMKKHQITIGFKDAEKDNRTVPRNRLLVTHLNKIFTNTDFGKNVVKAVGKVDIEFLLDQFGEVLYPEQWMTECQGRPYSYTISLRPTPPPVEDANDDPDYMGDASIFIENVPVQVDAMSLEQWLKRGIQSETPQIEKMRKHVAKGLATVAGIAAKLQVCFIFLHETRIKPTLLIYPHTNKNLLSSIMF